MVLLSTIVAAISWAGGGAAAAMPRMVFVKTTAGTPLDAGASVMTFVQEVTLGSGPWTVLGRAFLTDSTSGESDFVRCELFNATAKTPIDTSAGWVEGDGVVGNMITNLAKLTVASGSTVTIQQWCWHDHDVQHISVASGATLVGFKALSATGNRLKRTTPATPLGPGQTTVATVSISPGTWLVGFKATAVDVSTSTNNTPIECTLPGGSIAGRGLSGQAFRSSVSTMLGLTAVTVSLADTIKVTCDAPDNAGYLDPGAVLWARRVSSAVVGNSCGTVTGAVGSTDLVIDRRTTSCPVGTGTSASQVGGGSIPAGTWLILGAEQELETTAAGYVRCQIKDATHNRVLDARATDYSSGDFDTAGSVFSGTTYVGEVSPSAKTVVQFRCGTANEGASSGYGGYVLLRP